GVASHMAFSPDGGRLAVSEEFGKLCLWDACSGRPVWSWDANADPSRAPGAAPVKLGGIDLSSDGKALAVPVTDDAIRWCDAVTGKELLRVKAKASGVTFAPDGKTLASFDFMGQTVSLWERATGKRLHTLGHPQAVSSLAFSHDGRSLAV